LRRKHFHGISSASPHAYSLKSRYGKARILFGSHASGRPDEWSDIDIAVISPQFDALFLLERYEQLGLANRDLHAPLDIVGFSPSQIAQCEPESFLAEILRTGVEVPVRPRRPAPHQLEEGTNLAHP
jgi:uncharacterized protein